MDRRHFLKVLGAQSALVALAPGLYFRQAIAAPNAKRVPASNANKTVVFLFQRGAMDGLSLVAPVGDPEYFKLRPSLALSRSGEAPVMMLDDVFGLHPACAPLQKFWNEGTLSFVHQVGSPDPSRSHFDAQDFVESGTPGVRSTRDGFLNRALAQLDGSATGFSLRGVALQPSMPRVLQGDFPAVSMNSLRDFSLQAKGDTAEGEAAGFEKMYQGATDAVFRGAGKEAFGSLTLVQNTLETQKGDSRDLYPKGPLGNRLHDIASLIKARSGLQVAVTDLGGWDTHVNQGAHKGQLADRFRDLSGALAAFAADLGPLFNDVIVITQTEFGRTAKENGTRGTDHGHGSVLMALGGNVRGKNVHAQWKGLENKNLFEGRDVPVLHDYRDLWSEVLTRHLGVSQLASVFPGFQSQPKNWVGLLRS